MTLAILTEYINTFSKCVFFIQSTFLPDFIMETPLAVQWDSHYLELLSIIGDIQ